MKIFAMFDTQDMDIFGRIQLKMEKDRKTLPSECNLTVEWKINKRNEKFDQVSKKSIHHFPFPLIPSDPWHSNSEWSEERNREFRAIE